MKITIKSKLIITFSLIMVLLVGLGIYSVSTIQKVNKASMIIAKEWLKRADYAHSLNTLLANFRIAENKHITLESKADKGDVEKQIEGINLEINNVLGAYDKLIYNEEDKEMLMLIKADFNSVNSVYERMKPISRALDREEAEALVVNEGNLTFDILSISCAG
jgi:methyl-accepting chemotaxis protein